MNTAPGPSKAREGRSFACLQPVVIGRRAVEPVRGPLVDISHPELHNADLHNAKGRFRMTAKRLLKLLLNVKDAYVDDYDLTLDRNGRLALTVRVHPSRKDQWRCPECGRKCPVYDCVNVETAWRGMDFGSVTVRIVARVPRVECKRHGVLTAMVPWAQSGSRFTRDFISLTAWLVKGGLSKKCVSELLRIDWKTVGRLVKLAWKMLEADPKERYKGLKLIGIDETSYRKGHSYITVVVNHETNTVVWAHKGHGKEVLDIFFKELTREQRESIEVVTGDGARWITDCIMEHCPNAKRCVEPFHVVEWANAALDEVRREAWRRALDKVQRIEARIGKEKNEKRKAGLGDKLSKAKVSAEQIKNSRYAVGKNPEHLTARQRTKLELIQAEDGPLARAHAMKEQLRIIFRETDADEAEKSLDAWITRTQRCRIESFVELQRKIARHKEHILNAIRFKASNAIIEATNNKIKLLIRVAYGFRNIDSMISLIMLCCSSIRIPLPGREAPQPMKQGGR